jgi:hypothetical protein
MESPGFRKRRFMSAADRCTTSRITHETPTSLLLKTTPLGLSCLESVTARVRALAPYALSGRKHVRQNGKREYRLFVVAAVPVCFYHVPSSKTSPQKLASWLMQSEFLIASAAAHFVTKNLARLFCIQSFFSIIFDFLR